MIDFINDLSDYDSQISSDVNDLFLSLEIREEEVRLNMIEILSEFFMDLITNLLYTHYDPSWFFLNNDKYELNNRLSKQKEREKQQLISRFDNATADERFAMRQKESMGISKYWKEFSQKNNDYVNSEEHSLHNQDERYERINELLSQSNLELDLLSSNDDSLPTNPILNTINPTTESRGYDIHQQDNDNDNYQDELDQEYDDFRWRRTYI